MLPVLRPGASITARNQLHVDAVAGRVVDVRKASVEAVREPRAVLRQCGLPNPVSWIYSPVPFSIQCVMALTAEICVQGVERIDRSSPLIRGVELPSGSGFDGIRGVSRFTQSSATPFANEVNVLTSCTPKGRLLLFRTLDGHLKTKEVDVRSVFVAPLAGVR
jgi:hypothetical protein